MLSEINFIVNISKPKEVRNTIILERTIPYSTQQKAIIMQIHKLNKT